MLGKEHPDNTDEHEQLGLGAEPTGQVRAGRRDAEEGWIYLTGVVTEPGPNAASNKGAVWIGPGGTYTKTFNNAGEDLILIIWAPMLRGLTLIRPSSRLTSPPVHMNHKGFVDVC